MSRERQYSFLKTGSNHEVDPGIVTATGNSAEQTFIRVVTELLGYKPEPSLVDKIKEIMKDKNLKSPSEAIMFIND